jgi:hypothetical protein
MSGRTFNPPDLTKSAQVLQINMENIKVGAVFGHVMTVKHCCQMMGPLNGCHRMKACWDMKGIERK